jgi:hypothetical protein
MIYQNRFEISKATGFPFLQFQNNVLVLSVMAHICHLGVSAMSCGIYITNKHHGAEFLRS